jgi:GntR family transcriptional regulator
LEATWNEDQPIYRQLMAEIVSWILEGRLKDGDPLPSIRAIASEYNINPLTASKAYQELSSIDVLERRRGIGLFIRPGARARLMRAERQKFLNEDWPQIVRRIRQMGLDPSELVEAMEKVKDE